MKTARKAIMAVLCVLCVIVASITGTLAYLTDTESVTNTFTVGKVGLELDEAKTDEYGVEIAGQDRVKANEYKLIPGHEYKKDPQVRIDADSENCWVFVKVVNGISTLETSEATKTIDGQIKANGWTELTVGSGIYYKEWKKFENTGNLEGEALTTAQTAHHTLNVFATFTLKGAEIDNKTDGGKIDIDEFATEINKDSIINVTAYAIQRDGIDTPADAWSKLSA